jgi:hypothetical protein
MPNKLQIKFIKDALDSEHMLSEWESEFINNIAELDDDKPLSKKQNETLNRITTKINRGEVR